MTEKLIKGKIDATKGITKTNLIPASMKSRAEILRVLKTASLFDIIWYSSFIALGAVCIFLFHDQWMTYLTVSEMLCGLLAANLIARGKIIGIWLNILDCLMFGVIAFISHAYGEMIKVLVISNIFNIYGIINWSKASKETTTDDFNVRILSKKMSAIFYPSFIALVVCVYFILNAVGTSKAYLGCITFSCNIAIKYLQMSRYRESWYFALLNDIISFVMWAMILYDNVSASGDWSVLPTVGTALGFLINSINGMLVWNKLFKRSVFTGSIYLAMRPMHIKRFIVLKHNYQNLTWVKEKDHVSTPEEIAIARKMRVSFRRGMFSSGS